MAGISIRLINRCNEGERDEKRSITFDYIVEERGNYRKGIGKKVLPPFLNLRPTCASFVSFLPRRVFFPYVTDRTRKKKRKEKRRDPRSCTKGTQKGVFWFGSGKTFFVWTKDNPVPRGNWVVVRLCDIFVFGAPYT